MNDLATPLRLIAVLLVLCMALLLMAQHFHGIPLIGQLPGDFEIELPRGTVFIPVSTTLLFGLLLTLIALAIQKLQRK
ncbi:MAG: DUF2905 family protein [Bacteroidota bacterium]|jgi:hypothetical protein|nr:DUF2905 family protein [Bacteroidota bacterium]